MDVTSTVGVLSVNDDELRPLLRRFAPPGMELVYRAGGNRLFPQKAAERIRCLLVFGAAVDGALLEHLPALRCVQLLSAGFDNIDVPALTERGIRIADNAGLNAAAVADHAVMMMLMCLRNGLQAHENVRAGRWQAEPLGILDIEQLTGKKVGIIGCGRIGQKVARRVSGFDTTVVYHDIRSVTLPDELRSLKAVTMRELLADSDIVTLHVPLTTSTTHLIRKDTLCAMKRGAVLVNTSRGGVVDLDALADALEAGHLRSAGLDVFEREPAVPRRLTELPNVVLSPHRAGSSRENWEARVRFAFGNLGAFLESHHLEAELCTGSEL